MDLARIQLPALCVFVYCCSRITAAAPDSNLKTISQLAANELECPLPEVQEGTEAVSGLSVFQVRYESIHVSSLPADSETHYLEVNKSQERLENASAKESSERTIISPSPGRSVSVLQLFSENFAGWTSVLIILLCCCMCGTATGEFLLGRLYRFSVALSHMSSFGEDELEEKETPSGYRGRSKQGVRSGSKPSDASSFESEKEDHHGAKLYEDYLSEFWEYYSRESEPDVFSHDGLRIANDGGMKDVPNLKVKYGRAVVVIGVGLMNCILILATDLAALNHIGPSMDYGHQDFLLTKWLWTHLLNVTEQRFVSYMLGYDMNKIVPLIELMFVFLLVLFLVLCLAGIVLSPMIFPKGGELQKWSCASTLFWFCVPQLMSCSALRLLHYVNPNVIMSDGYVVMLQALQTVALVDDNMEARRLYRHYAHSISSVLFFVLTRTLAGIIGFDVFLVKFRLASSAVDSGKTDVYSQLAAIAFVWQVMGIIQLKWFVEKRLFIFMFAGKDGSMDIDEEALVDVWKAMLLKKVYSSLGFVKGTIVMLGFDTYDLQFLALDDDEDEIRQLMSSRFIGGSTGIGISSIPTGVSGLRRYDSSHTSGSSHTASASPANVGNSST